MTQKHMLIDNEHIKIELEKGILIGTWKCSFVDLDIAQKVVNDRLKATLDKAYPILVDMKSIKGSNQEARIFLASEKGCKGIAAGAICVNSILETMIASLFLFLNKPIVPAKIFKDEAKAREWLAGFVEKNNSE